ncbi:hypothetical protein FN846DRAFT_895941 [Sphaerosporella brunnea]|uniref:Uncharacterized protein n=1 Tax=Sphaerosporella brunnea TaxID=1250544 RepID=A0A5J5EER9_9PEZI|nr:hypothetical protein FN846DRAFT_895941 [Sphaerosporella brunnea]
MAPSRRNKPSQFTRRARTIHNQQRMNSNGTHPLHQQAHSLGHIARPAYMQQQLFEPQAQQQPLPAWLQHIPPFQQQPLHGWPQLFPPFQHPLSPARQQHMALAPPPPPPPPLPASPSPPQQQPLPPPVHGQPSLPGLHPPPAPVEDPFHQPQPTPPQRLAPRESPLCTPQPPAAAPIGAELTRTVDTLTHFERYFHGRYQDHATFVLAGVRTAYQRDMEAERGMLTQQFNDRLEARDVQHQAELGTLQGKIQKEQQETEKLRRENERLSERVLMLSREVARQQQLLVAHGLYTPGRTCNCFLN